MLSCTPQFLLFREATLRKSINRAGHVSITGAPVLLTVASQSSPETAPGT